MENLFLDRSITAVLFGFLSSDRPCRTAVSTEGELLSDLNAALKVIPSATPDNIILFDPIPCGLAGAVTKLLRERYPQKKIINTSLHPAAVPPSQEPVVEAIVSLSTLASWVIVHPQVPFADIVPEELERLGIEILRFSPDVPYSG